MNNGNNNQPPALPAGGDQNPGGGDDPNQGAGDGQPPVAPGANANPQQRRPPMIIPGAQVSVIPEFEGEESIDTDSWLRAVDQAQTVYGWDSERTAAAARLRLRKHALRWIESVEEQGTKYERWETFRPAIRKRFYPTINEIAASDAVMNLTMQPSETCSQFMDRVVLATYKMHHKIPQDSPIRRDANFIAAIEDEIYALFSRGLSQSVREIVFGAEVPPKTVAGLLDACKAIESQRQRNPRIQVATVQAAANEAGHPLGHASASSPPQPDTATVLAELVEELKIARTRTTLQSRTTTVKCYYCGKVGHFQRDCFSRQRDEAGRGQTGKGKRGSGGGRGRRGRGSGNAGRQHSRVDSIRVSEGLNW